MKLRWVGHTAGPRPPATGFGDLLRAYDRLGQEHLEDIAELLGYTCKLKPVTAQSASTTPTPTPPTLPVDEADFEIEVTEGGAEPPPVPRKPKGLDPALFLRAKASIEREPNYKKERDFGPPLKLADVTGVNRGKVVSSRRGPALASWARIGAHLRHVLGDQSEGSELDVRTLVDQWSRGTFLQRLPRRKRRVWPSRVVVVVDRSRRLIPFWEDQDLVIQRLRDELGELRVEEHTQIEGPFATTFVTRGKRTEPLRQHQIAGPVIALSDLGHYAHDNGQSLRRWQRYASEMSRAGHPLIALLPVPVWRWQPDVTRSWHAYAWERARGVAAGPAQLQERSQTYAQQILDLVAVSSRVEPGLLREIRQLIPRADVAAEAEAWNHPDVFGTTCLGLRFRTPDVQAQARRRFSGYSEELRNAAVKRVLAYHQELDRELFGEDILQARELTPEVAVPEETWAAIRQRILAIAAMLREPKVEIALRKSYLDWIERLGPRLSQGVWNDSEVGDALTQCYAEVRRDRNVRLPEGLSPRRAAEFEDNPRPPQVWQVNQVGRWLVFDPTPPRRSVRKTRPSSPLATVTSSNREVAFEWEGRTQTSRLDPEVAARVSVGELRSGVDVVVHTDFTTVTLEGFRPPAWASGMWRDAHGLWVEVKDNDQGFKLCWHPPTDEVGAEGHWRASDPPAWATAMGRDTYGLWADIQVGQVTARMRWIPPGTFLMGSPRDQHRVELTHGFWLADTPCTQALWQEVMGSTPSKFRGAERPVESVSWRDAVAFCERLQLRVPSEEAFRLPSEAEWEYACRAGTKTATYAGENAVLNTIAWTSENSEAITHPVKGLQPNGWGLYDTLGNVWEWCADRFPGVAHGRVLRGGSRVYGAGSVHAAFRVGNEPGRRLDVIGFRFARGTAPGR